MRKFIIYAGCTLLLLNSCTTTIDPAVQRKTVLEYNQSYQKKINSRITDILAREDSGSYIKKNTVSLEEMCNELRKSKVVIFSDVEFSPKQKKQYIELLEMMGKSDVIFGTELLTTRHTPELKRYLNREIGIKEFYQNIGYTYIMDIYIRMGYGDMFIQLRENKIQSIGIDKAMDPRLEEFLQRMIKEGKAPPYDLPEGFTNEDINKMDRDFYNRDNIVTKLVGDVIKKGKTFVIMVGAAHSYDNHLCKMIKDEYGLDPAVVEWGLSGLRFVGNRLYYNDSTYQLLLSKGLTENNALKIGNDYYINFRWKQELIDEYINAVSIR